jgi:acetyl/propionyl-CoA carboxylase alpha subunit
VKRIFRIGEERHELLVLPHQRGRRLRIAGTEHLARLEALGQGEYRIELDGVGHRAWIAVRGDAIHVHLRGRSWTLEAIDELAETSAHGAGASDTAEAPMPGTVIRVLVGAGEAVNRGQTLVVIESMKMETAIVAWRDGVVAEVHRPVGATFDRKAPLVSLKPEAVD